MIREPAKRPVLLSDQNKSNTTSLFTPPTVQVIINAPPLLQSLVAGTLCIGPGPLKAGLDTVRSGGHQPSISENLPVVVAPDIIGTCVGSV